MFAVIIGVFLVLLFFEILFLLISGGLISASVLVGFQQRSVSKGFKTLFLSVSIFGATIISVIFFWFLNKIEHWWNNAGIVFGLLSGWILGIVIFTAVKKLVLFLKNKFDKKINLTKTRAILNDDKDNVISNKDINIIKKQLLYNKSKIN